MALIVDVLYLVVAIITAPVWLARMILTGKIRTDWAGRFGSVPPEKRTSDASRPVVLLHAVSVGEVNATRPLVEHLAAHPSRPTIVVSATTNTGFRRAIEVFDDCGPRVRVVRYPLDLSFAVRRFLDAIAPDVVALVELEVWPNFIAACTSRGIRVGVVNGRLSERSAKRYALIRPFVRASFHALAFVGAQTEDYADRFVDMGAVPDRVHVTDTVKWDTARIEDDVDASAALAAHMGIDRTRPLVVAGSTAPSEHALIRDCMPPGVQLLCAPRKPEWFEQAARDLPGCARRSAHTAGSATDRFLLDTMGELRAAYALADIVIVGRTFDDLGGSDMMEPVGLGKATIIGPDVRNFAETAHALLEADGIVAATRNTLARTVQDLLENPERRAELARNGRAVIRERQGASAASAAMVMKALHAFDTPDHG